MPYLLILFNIKFLHECIIFCGTVVDILEYPIQFVR